jgi:hypothetical protein
MFDRVKELRKKGKRPIIRLTPAALIPKPVRGPGRPRKYPPGHPLASRYRGRRGKSRPRCLAKGCPNMLKINQEAACSPVCADRIVNDALLRLKQCGVSKAALVDLYTDD